MANPEHVAILTRGVDEWIQWRYSHKEVPDFSGADFHGIDLSEAKLEGANFGGANLTGTRFRNADLANTDFSNAQLQNADLSDAYMADAVFDGASLVEADLRHANVERCTFDYADLTHASLRRALLSFSNMRGATLYGADLGETMLGGTTFDNTFLDGANLELAEFGSTKFLFCNLSQVRGLDTGMHWNPSSLGIECLYLSDGKISEIFLRGCGVPETFITQMRSLVNAEGGIQYYSCFLCHSTKDNEFTERLYGKMRAARLRVYYAPEDMPGGKKLHEEIETQIRMHDKLLIVLSEHSLESEWVKTELRRAFKEERASERAGKKKRKLFPVRLTDMERIKAWSCFDADSGKNLGVELREYFIRDFSRWKEHDQFEASFARLLKDLKADEPGR
jgi:uncharacterized protein YjbI with pentapeptide repeats